MKNTDNIKRFSIPKDEAEVTFERIKPYLDLYLKEQRFENDLIDTRRSNFGLKQFGISAYMQGLTDAIMINGGRIRGMKSKIS